MKPFANPFNLDMFESEIYIFTDSVTKMGKTAATKWPEIHSSNLRNAGVSEMTFHGLPHNFIWDFGLGLDK